MSGVLFTCAGQRVDIVTAFKRAGARTVATDVNRLAPALYHADAHAFVPRVDDPDYVATLRALVARARHLADRPAHRPRPRRARRARGTSSARSCCCRRPRSSTRSPTSGSRTCSSTSAASARRDTWLPDALPADVEFPVLVKARHGFGSRGIYRCDDRRELEFFLGYTTEDSMVQACCRGEEFSIDLFCDLESRCLNAVPRTMIESKGGESIKGMTIRDDDLIEVGRLVSETLGLVGPGERPVLPRAGRHASRHRHQPALRRRLPAADRGRQPLSRSSRSRSRRASGPSRGSATSAPASA